MNVGNLVVLRYALNESYFLVDSLSKVRNDPEVQERFPGLYKDFKVVITGPNKGTWTFYGITHNIGESYFEPERSFGIVGVFNSRFPKHLEKMVSDASEHVRSNSRT